MKLKERLASEYDIQCGGTISTGNWDHACPLEDAFIAGFEKAREMAAERVKHIELIYGIEMGLVLGPKTKHETSLSVRDVVMALGEEDASVPDDAKPYGLTYKDFEEL